MVKPSLSQLMEKENINRYALVVATAKCAREITEEYVREREYAESKSGGAKESERTALSVITPKYRDEKAVQNAIEELFDGEYRIIKETLPEGMGVDRPEVDEATEAGAEAETEAEETEKAEEE